MERRVEKKLPKQGTKSRKVFKYVVKTKGRSLPKDGLRERYLESINGFAKVDKETRLANSIEMKLTRRIYDQNTGKWNLNSSHRDNKDVTVKNVPPYPKGFNE
jgi:hypothetical protein